MAGSALPTLLALVRSGEPSRPDSSLVQFRLPSVRVPCASPGPPRARDGGGGDTVRVLSLGAGVQSSTLLLMAVHDEVQIDRAIFADTQDEPSATYTWLETLMPIAERAGIPIDVVTAGNLREDSLHKRGWLVSMPLHILNVDGTGGILTRKCTNGYKLRPIQRRLRELGATARRPATVLVGISRDEALRQKPSRVKYIVNEFPLIERQMSRHDCVRWLREHGYPEPPKSACIVCPYRDNRSWRRMRDQQPDEWASAVAFDQQVRNAAQTKKPTTAYVHRSLVPLPMVDLSTPQDAGQMEMFEGGECDGFSCMGDAS